MSIRSYCAVAIFVLLASMSVDANRALTPVLAFDESGANRLLDIAAGVEVSVSGRVRTASGRPIRSAWIVLKDADTNEVVATTYSTTFGYYRLTQIEAGGLYVLSVQHKRYLFAFPAQVLELNEDRTGVDFIGELNS